MIGFLPEIYEDELVYSWIARYYCRTGYNAYIYANEDFYTHSRTRPDMEYMNQLSEDATTAISGYISIEKLIREHTMIPQIRFTEPETLRKAWIRMLTQAGSLREVVLGSRSGRNRQLRYCPLCVREDRELYGETWWHRSAQIHGVGICVKHKCRLVSTGIQLKADNKRLHIAELEVRDYKPQYVDNEKELAFVSYIAEVFYKEINFDNTISINSFLASRIDGTEYLREQRHLRNMKLLYEDMMKFYQGYPFVTLNKPHQLVTCLKGQRHGLFDICQIAYFLGITANELVALDVSGTELEKSVRYDNAETDYEISEGTRRKIPNQNCYLHAKKKRKNTHYFKSLSGKQNIDWAKIDNELLPFVHDKCVEIYGVQDSKPGRVGIKTIEKALHLPDNRFQYLPRCRAEILLFKEKKEEHWARKTVWGFRQLTNQRPESVTFTKLIHLTGIHADRMMKCLPYLSMFCDKDEEMKIKQLVIPRFEV